MLRTLLLATALILAGCVGPGTSVPAAAADETTDSDETIIDGTANVPEDERTPSAPKAATPGTVPAAPRDPVTIGGALLASDPTLNDGAACAKMLPHRDATRGHTWNAWPLPSELSNWTWRIAPSGFTVAFSGFSGHPEGTVPAGATEMLVCNHQSSWPGFQVTFLAPERVPDPDWSYRIEGTLHAADPTWRDTGVCRGYGDVRRVVHDSVTAVTRHVHALPPDVEGQAFIIEGQGAVSDINGRMWGARAAPIGVIPEGATTISVCSTSSVPVHYTLIIGRGEQA